MARRCTVCARKDVRTVNKALVKRNASIRQIAADFSISESSLRRHFKNDVPKSVEAAKAQKAEVDHGLDVIGWIREDREIIEAVRERAQERVVLVRVPDAEAEKGYVYEERTVPDDGRLLETVRVSAKVAEITARVQGEIPFEGETKVVVRLAMNERAEEG
jgi:AcrR family transcriptional regulator